MSPVGVGHGQDSRYMIGHVFLEDNPEVVDDMEITAANYTQTDKEYANYWMNLFTNFVKFG